MTPRASPDRVRLLAGLVDVALSSLASFVVGTVAVRELPPTVLGAYALVFAAFTVAGNVPAQLVFAPLEILAVACPRSGHRALLHRTLRMGAVAGSLAALGTVVWVVGAPPDVPLDAVVALTVTGVATTFLSPLQDHVRRMLHIAHASGSAVAVSAAQLVAVALGLWTCAALHVAPHWTPLGVLACANLLSAATGVVLAQRLGGDRDVAPRPRLAEVLPTGRWLAILGFLAPGAAFLASLLVARIAGAAVLGYAEAARVGGMPMMVLAAGLSATLTPRIVAATQAGDVEGARAARRLFTVLLVAAGVVYAVVASTPWALNPLGRLLPRAYVVPGLLGAIVLGNLAFVVSFPQRDSLVTLGRGAEMVRLELVVSALRIAIGAGAGVLGAFALPLGNVVSSVYRVLAYGRLLRSQTGIHDEGFVRMRGIQRIFRIAPRASAAPHPASGRAFPEPLGRPLPERVAPRE